MFALALVGLTGLVIAAVGLTQGPDITKIADGLGWPVSYVGAAREWSTWYRVPLEWVLATIIVESEGKPNVRGDGGKSLGLMQVNSVAHAAELMRAGVSPSQLLDPSTNIQWGTKYLRQFKDEVETALNGRTPPIPLSWVVRLYYKGPKYVTEVLERGGNPATALSWAPEALQRWAAAMARVTALTGEQVA